MYACVSCCCQWVGVCARNNVNSFNWLYIKFIVNLSLSDDSASTVCLWIFVCVYSILFLYLQTMFLLPLLINAQYFTHVFVAYFTFFFFFNTFFVFLFFFVSSTVLLSFFGFSSICFIIIIILVSMSNTWNAQHTLFSAILVPVSVVLCISPFYVRLQNSFMFFVEIFLRNSTQIKRVEQQYHISMQVRSDSSKIYNMLVYIRLTRQLIWLSFFIYHLSHIIHLSCIGSVFHLFSDQTGGRRQLEVLILSVQNEARFIRIFSPILFFVI